jgi:HK97 family phage prohead protease/HK97 family phage major capsid protein
MTALERYSEDQPRDEHGEWTSGGDGSSGTGDKPGTGTVKERISSFLKGPGLAAIHAVGEKLKDNQKELLAGAVTAGLYHVVGLDFPVDVEEAVRHEVAHFSDNAQITAALARDYMRRAVDSLIALRRKAVEEDEVLKALMKLKAVLDKDELFNDGNKSREVRPMPLPKPHKGESQDDFMGRCMHEAYGPDAPSDRTQEQAVAMCYQAWRDKDKGDPKKQLEPDDGESFEDFFDRCMDEIDDEDACQLIWDNSDNAGAGEYCGMKQNSVLRKTHSENVQGMEFVLSDESVDRIGDVISAEGWQLDNFKKNPIALWSHRSDQPPIGTWENLRIDNKALRGKLNLAPKGTSPRIDEIRSLIDAGILRAVSVGFRDLESEPIDKNDVWGGRRFTKQELVECSLVSVPANANALAVAKSMRISPATMDLIFAKHGNRDQVKRRGFIGKHASTSRDIKGGSAMSLSQRISEVEIRLVDRKDKLVAHWANADNTNVSDTDMQVANDLNAEIVRLEKQHTALVESEQILAKTVNGNDHVRPSRALVTTTALTQAPPVNNEGVTAPAIIRSNRRKELDPIDYLVRAGTIVLRAKSWNRLPDDVRQKTYGDDEETKVVCDLVLRAASAPAMTGVAGWAQELVQQKYTDLMPLLMPSAILTRLAARGLTYSFGQMGRIIIPTRNRTPTISGSFVGEGSAIPVRQGGFASQTLVPKKLGVISVWTREMADHSTPAIEGLIREAIQQDTSVAVDTVLIDANAASAIRPPGLLNGVAATTATAGGGIAALIGDITALEGALTTNTYGNVRTPVLLVNPTDMLRASLLQAANTGIFPFQSQIAAGNLNGVPLIDSSTVPTKTMILIDAADFVVVGGDAPRLELSDVATLHMEDTTPLDLVSGGSPAVVAAPQRSLFQTDSLALRMVTPLNWVQRRSGTIAWTQNVTW